MEPRVKIIIWKERERGKEEKRIVNFSLKQVLSQ
jgi:hypothetical protein